MSQSNEYRIPTLDEFVDGFEYERYEFHTDGGHQIDLVNSKWVKQIVTPSMYKINTNTGEEFIRAAPNTIWTDHRFRYALENGLIRTKIKNNEA